LNGGLSPAALAHAYLHWASHLAFAPGKQLQLVDKAMRKAVRFGNYTIDSMKRASWNLWVDGGFLVLRVAKRGAASWQDGAATSP
jgi:hypothetical protein